MLKTITQSVHFPVPSHELYSLYLSPTHHAAITGAPVKISPKPNSKFQAFNGMLTGKILLTVPNQLIVQLWRSCEFHDDDLDSILILRFVDAGKRGRIDLVHANVPEHDYAGVTEGWNKYYWKPLRAYLKGEGRKARRHEGT
jgi:activator of HSP90 ATPase